MPKQASYDEVVLEWMLALHIPKVYVAPYGVWVTDSSCRA